MYAHITKPAAHQQAWHAPHTCLPHVAGGGHVGIGAIRRQVVGISRALSVVRWTRPGRRAQRLHGEGGHPMGGDEPRSLVQWVSRAPFFFFDLLGEILFIHGAGSRAAGARGGLAVAAATARVRRWRIFTQ